MVLPTVALVLVSLTRLWTGRFDPARASLANYEYVLFNYQLTQQAIINSLILAVVVQIGSLLRTRPSWTGAERRSEAAPK